MYLSKEFLPKSIHVCTLYEDHLKSSTPYPERTAQAEHFVVAAYYQL